MMCVHRDTCVPTWVLLLAFLSVIPICTAFSSAKHFEVARLPVSSPTYALRLRGGNGEPPTGSGGYPRAWEVKDVLEFVESLRWKFGDRTESYKTLFEENDVDGKVLLGLSPSKLEQIGMKSLGHREFFTAQVIKLRSSIGLPVGPAPGEFEAAMAAQSAPAGKPPTLVSEAPPEASNAEQEWTSIERVAWSQEGRNIDYYVFLDGVGAASKDDIEVSIDRSSIRVRVRNLDGRNYQHHLRRLYGPIQPKHSFWKVKKDSVCFKLFKDKDDTWPKLHFDPRDAEEASRVKEQMRGDPEQAMIQMMRGLYEGGDAETRQMIAKTWTEAQEKHARGDDAPWKDRLGDHFDMSKLNL